MNNEMTLQQWYEKYDKTAARQGWGLFTCDGHEGIAVIDIQRIDMQGDNAASDAQAKVIARTHKQLRNDDEAYRIVIKQAAQGCIMSLLALWLAGRAAESTAWIPKPLRRGKTVLV